MNGSMNSGPRTHGPRPGCGDPDPGTQTGDEGPGTWTWTHARGPGFSDPDALQFKGHRQSARVLPIFYPPAWVPPARIGQKYIKSIKNTIQTRYDGFYSLVAVIGGGVV